MTWAAIITVLLELFGPAVRAWLERLLHEASDHLPPPADADREFNAAVSDLFDAAESRLWWWEFRRHLAVRAAKRAALRRSAPLRARAAGRAATVEPLTAVERADLDT